jgi:4-amino-4-deoxy-L-arabinose transferase-like glycosyltransferase
MTSAANNDVLAELLLAMILLLTIRYLKDAVAPEGEGVAGRLLVLLGITTGLGLITKSSVYIALPLVSLAILVRHLWLDQDPPPLRGTIKAGVLYLLPAIGLALPWWLRNIAAYGGLDFLGLVRHDQVVAGQLRTTEFVAKHGLARLVEDFFSTSFRSFWGQFGWMGVLLDMRLYQVMAILSALALVGFLLWAVRIQRNRDRAAAWQWAAGGLLALSGLFTLAAYIWYNTSLLQHQGRYLFSALVPISLAVALGWREVLRRERVLLLAVLLIGIGIVLWLLGALTAWLLLMLAVTVVAFGIRYFLPRSWDPLVCAVPYLLLILLDLVSLFLFVIPQLKV